MSNDTKDSPNPTPLPGYRYLLESEDIEYGDLGYNTFIKKYEPIGKAVILTAKCFGRKGKDMFIYPPIRSIDGTQPAKEDLYRLQSNKRHEPMGCGVFRRLDGEASRHFSTVRSMSEMGKDVSPEYADHADKIRDRYIDAINAFNSHRSSCDICKYLNEATYHGGTREVLRVIEKDRRNG